jgi:hypothetical protein
LEGVDILLCFYNEVWCVYMCMCVCVWGGGGGSSVVNLEPSRTFCLYSYMPIHVTVSFVHSLNCHGFICVLLVCCVLHTPPTKLPLGLTPALPTYPGSPTLLYALSHLSTHSSI